MTGRSKGIALTAAGAFMLTIDSLLLRLIGADRWAVVFHRGWLTFVACTVVWLVMNRRSTMEDRAREVRASWLTGCLYGANSVLFVLAIQHTRVANVLFVAATAPLHAAVLSHFVLRERLAPSLWAALCSAGVGVLLLLGSGIQSGEWVGNVLALGSSMLMGASLVTARRTRAGGLMVPMLGGLLCALASAPLGLRFPFDPTRTVYLLLDGALVLPLAFGLLMLGPRHLPAPQVGLFLLLEPVLGALWARLLLGEVPSGRVILGGGVIITTLVAQNLYSLRRRDVAADAVVRTAS